MSRIELRGINKYYGRNHVLKDINLVIEDGEFMTLLGPSGCGKTTTLRVVAGLEKPQEGYMYMGDREIVNAPEKFYEEPGKRHLNLVFQSYALWPHMTVFDNVAFGLEVAKVPKEEIRRKVENALKRMRIEAFIDRYPSELSGGQQQRVAIARALVKMPHVLLLDEPLSNLDARLRLQTREEIRKIQRATQITTVFVTHDQEEAMSISDEIVVMKQGVVQQIGKPQEVYDDPVNLFVAKFLGTPPINIFHGKIQNDRLTIGEAAVLPVSGIPDQEVWAGVRPEGFLLQEDGPLSCSLNGVEVMGRDISIVSTHPDCENTLIRAIAGSENGVNTASETVRFALKPGKVFLFDKNNGERIREA